jgi:hypothetical protein
MSRPFPSLCALCLLCALAVACGEAQPPAPPHGLDTKGLESKPEGDALTPTYDTKDGATYRAVLSVTTEAFKKGVEGGRKKDEILKLHITLEHIWQHRRPPHGAPPTSSIELRYLDAEGHSAEIVRNREPVTGRLAHDPKGRPLASSLQLAGGTKAEQYEVLDLVGSILWAGYGGAPSWLPARPLRVGEAWPLRHLANLRARQNLRGRARELGMSNPEPSFEGTARLRRITEGPDGPLLEVELDALIELEGTLRNEDGSPRAFSSGDRFQGLATINAKTGVPTSFDVSHIHRENQTSGKEKVAIGATATVRGTVTQTDAGR